MGNLKFELIIFYYKRPEIVLNALESIKKSYYKNWHLTLIDDSGNDDFKTTFLKYGFDNKKISYVPIMMSDEEKIKLGGSIFGKYANDVIENSDADIIIPICDDDALLPDYMGKLNDFYSKNPDKVWAYCHNKYFNPKYESYKDAKLTPDTDLIVLFTFKLLFLSFIYIY
jgi:glycosyltransferase involved in cell wall biosynthesis